MRKLIQKKQVGGYMRYTVDPTSSVPVEEQINAINGAEQLGAEMAQYQVPIWGTIKSIGDAIDNPNYYTISGAALSGLGDVFGLGGLNSFFKGAKAVSNSSKVLSEASKANEVAGRAYSTAISNYNRANKAANKARGVVDAMTLNGESIANITNAQRKANVFSDIARRASQELNDASMAYKGMPVKVSRNVVHGPQTGYGYNPTYEFQMPVKQLTDPSTTGVGNSALRRFNDAVSKHHVASQNMQRILKEAPSDITAYTASKLMPRVFKTISDKLYAKDR